MRDKIQKEQQQSLSQYVRKKGGYKKFRQHTAPLIFSGRRYKSFFAIPTDVVKPLKKRSKKF
jgi:tRNA 2-selenouridine synthase SelU